MNKYLIGAAVVGAAVFVWLALFLKKKAAPAANQAVGTAYSTGAAYNVDAPAPEELTMQDPATITAPMRIVK